MDALAQRIKARARSEGFEAARITAVKDDPQLAARLETFTAQGWHGDMDWMAETKTRRSSSLALWPEARSAIVLAQNYGPDMDPLKRLDDRSSGVISVYALNRDYHDVVKGKLKNLAQWLARETSGAVKVFVDTAPLMEKPLAQKAGLGWQGRHTNLVSRELGSWFFIGTILTTAVIEPDAPETDHCGSCRACLDICPTQAFPAPYQLDARRCISYLTIEYKGHIALEFRRAMGNRIYGCDDCLAVCPWNKFAAQAAEAKLKARDDLRSPSIAKLLTLDDATFRSLFAGSPVKRTGRNRFIRNVLIAAGNSGDPSLVPAITLLLADASALVRAMAVWALSQLADEPHVAQLRNLHMQNEADADVRFGVAGGMKHLLCFGLGFSARVLAARLAAQGWQISATSRSANGAVAIKALGYNALVFDGSAPLNSSAFDGVTHVVVSAPPGANGDPVLAQHAGDFARRSKQFHWAAYLSTTGVYGDHGGGLVTEDTPLTPNTERGHKRLLAEEAWLHLWHEYGLPVHIFRLAGIYGPGRNQLISLIDGTAKRVIKPGQVFSRIHVEDIATVLEASIATPHPGRAYNVCDDEAAPPQDVVEYGARLLGLPVPPDTPFDQAALSPMALSFYADSKRVSNQRIRQELVVSLAYPSYRQGLAALADKLKA